MKPIPTDEIKSTVCNSGATDVFMRFKHVPTGLSVEARAKVNEEDKVKKALLDMLASAVAALLGLKK